MGGLSKKGYQFDLAQEKAGVMPLVLDAGALLFKGNKLSRGKEEQEKISAAGIVKSYNLMGYKAVGVSGNDLAAGLDFLQEIQKKSSFAWLSANLVDTDTLQPVFSREFIYQANGFEIAVTALTSMQVNKQLGNESHVHVLPWQEILPGVIDQLSAASDMIILLSNLSVADNQAIAKQYDKINIIIQAGVSTANLTPKVLNNTLLCQTTSRGKYIGIMNIDWQQSALWGDKSKEKLQKKKGDLDRTLWQLSKYQKYEDPLKELAAIPRKLNTYKRLLAKQKGLEIEISRLEKQISENPVASGDGTPSTFRNHFVAMQSNLPDKPEIVEIVEEVNDAIFELGKKQAAALHRSDNLYAGWRACVKCHGAITEKWRQTRHAKAYDTLVQKKRQFDLNCIACHVTGVLVAEPGKALALPAVRQLVGCESCHGAGLKHISSPDRYKLTELPKEKICLQCHTAAHDNDFDYGRDVMQVH